MGSEKDKERSKRGERTFRDDRSRDRDRDRSSSRPGRGMTRATSMRSVSSSGDNLRGGDGGGRDRRSRDDSDKPRRSSSSRGLREKQGSFRGSSKDKRGESERGGRTTGGRTLERQTSNNEDSMAMLLGLAGKKGNRKRSGSSSSSSSSSSGSSSGKGPPITGEKAKPKNTKLNPKLFGDAAGDGSGDKPKLERRTSSNRSMSKEGSSRGLKKSGSSRGEGLALDLSDRGNKNKNTRDQDDSSRFTDASSYAPSRNSGMAKKFIDGDEDISTLNMSRLAFPTVDASVKKQAPTEPNTFISRPDLRNVDQSVNLRDLEAGKKKPGLGEVYLGESGSTAFSSGAFSATGSSSSRNSFSRNKRNPYLKVSPWEQFSYYVKDFCRSLSDCLCNVKCLAPVCCACLVVVVIIPAMMTGKKKKVVKSAELRIPGIGLGPNNIAHPVIDTIEHEGVTYLAPVFEEEEVAQRTATFHKMLVEHRMNSTDLSAKEALKWIAQYDPARLEIESDEGAILQRYALAVLFFTTHPGTMANRTTDAALSAGDADADGDDDSAGAETEADGVSSQEQDERRIDSFGANWMMDEDICSWQGIVCDETSTRVVHLNMSGTTLQGTLPAELALLKELTKVDMSHNYLEGVIPEIYIEHLTKLKYLMLNDNLLSGILPENLGDWSSLTYINLAENKIGGSLPTTLDELTDLMLLFLQDNLMSGTIPSMKGMKDLEYLYLNNNAFEGELPEDLFKDKALVDVRLEYNSLTGTIPDKIHKLHRLEVLSLGNNDLNGTVPDVFHHVRNLVALDLHKNEFSGTLPGSIAELTVLEHLLLDHNEFTGEISSLPTSLRTLVLHHNKFSGSIPDLGGMTDLHDLWLNDNMLVGPLPEDIGEVKTLVNVYLQNNALTGSVPESWNGLENIGSLRLYSNHLTGQISAELCELKETSSLSYLATDCLSEMECTCCDKCY